MRMMREMRVMSKAPGRDDDVAGADPDTLMRHRRIQTQRPTAVAVEPVPYEPKQSKRRVDWDEFIRSAEIT